MRAAASGRGGRARTPPRVRRGPLAGRTDAPLPAQRRRCDAARMATSDVRLPHRGGVYALVVAGTIAAFLSILAICGIKIAAEMLLKLHFCPDSATSQCW